MRGGGYLTPALASALALALAPAPALALALALALAPTLTRPPHEYMRWIRDPEHWGGGIELAVLAEHYSTELGAVDCQTQRVDLFGQASHSP